MDNHWNERSRQALEHAPLKTSTEFPDAGTSAAAVLDAAERLFGEHGLESVSIRDIAKAANVSISVIYHHFGSKAELLRTLLRLRLTELGGVREAVFAEQEVAASPDLRRILYGIIAPVARLRAADSGRQATMQFLARALVSTLPEVKDEGDTSVRALTRVVRLLERTLPQLDHADICWRLHFTFGIEHMTHWDDARLGIMSEGECDGNDVEESIERAIDFAQAAFLAPPRARGPRRRS